jgi:hypothetical protein
MNVLVGEDDEHIDFYFSMLEYPLMVVDELFVRV